MGEDDYLDAWIQIRSERGHASGSAHNENVLPGSKSIVETSKVREWAETYGLMTGQTVTEIRRGDDPPDAVCIIDGVSKTIECMEFVNGKLIERLKHANRQDPHARFSSSGGDGYWQAQWSKITFLEELKRELDRKVNKYRKLGLQFDYLVVYTSENWLFPQDVEEWLKEADIEFDHVFGKAFFLMEYHPGENPRYPVIQFG